MATISAKVIKARRAHKCSRCSRTILPGKNYLRLYGNATPSDKPYVMKLCMGVGCHVAMDAKIADALATHNELQSTTM